MSTFATAACIGLGGVVAAYFGFGFLGSLAALGGGFVAGFSLLSLLKDEDKKVRDKKSPFDLESEEE